MKQTSSRATVLCLGLLCGAALILRAQDKVPMDRSRGVGERIRLHTRLMATDVHSAATGHVDVSEHEAQNTLQVEVDGLEPGVTFDVTIDRGEGPELLGTITTSMKGEQRCFEARLSGDQEVPPVDTEATGMGKFILTGRDRATLRYEGKARGLSGPAIAAHVHKGAVGVAGPVVVPLDHVDLRGSIALGDFPNFITDLEAGNLYINVHTRRYPAGEIRGQITPCRGRAGRTFRLDANRGNTLPLGAASVNDLAGATVRVSNADGNVVLAGEITDVR